MSLWWAIQWARELGDWLLILGGLTLILLAGCSAAMSVIYPPLAIVRGPLAVLCRYAGAVLIVVGGVRLYSSHAVSVAMTARDAQERAAVVAERDRQHAASVAALEAVQRDADRRVAAAMAVRKAIANAKPDRVCVNIAPLRAAVDGVSSIGAAGYDAPRGAK